MSKCFLSASSKNEVEGSEVLISKINVVASNVIPEFP